MYNATGNGYGSKPPTRKKAKSPILIRLLGRVMESKRRQEAKAPSPILTRLLGRVAEVKFSQPAKASSPMVVTPLSITTVLIVL